MPQLIVPPQPSMYAPQFSPAGHAVRGVRMPWSGGVPHTLGAVAPQTRGAVQVPQLMLPPQPSM